LWATVRPVRLAPFALRATHMASHVVKVDCDSCLRELDPRAQSPKPMMLNLLQIVAVRVNGRQSPSLLSGAELGQCLKEDQQSRRPICRSHGENRERTLELHCGNCQARFVAYYGTEESADTETLDV